MSDNNICDDNNIINCLTAIENIGNTCYLNVIIQILNNIPEIRDLCFDTKIINKFKIKNLISKNEKNIKEKKLMYQFIRLIVLMNKKTTIVRPIKFKVVLDSSNDLFEGLEQHDCSEFLIYILNVIHSSLSYKVEINYSGKPKNLKDKLNIKSIKHWNNAFKNEYSLLTPLIYGQNKIKMIDINNKITYLFETFNILSLSIDNCETLYDCFNNFIKPEKIDNHDEYILKEECLWRLPKYLFIQLKRFNMHHKIDTLIDFPINNLDLSPYNELLGKKHCKYNLIGVVNHIGINNFGHYVCFIKDEGNWYLFNDDEIYHIDDENKIITENAYLLLYEKII